MAAQMTIDTRSFFGRSELLDYLVLRPLSHAKANWELVWDGDQYEPEEDSYAEDINSLIDDLGKLTPPRKYHDNEDRLAEYVKARTNWNVRKVGNRWVGSDYDHILEVGGFNDADQRDLMLAAAGRIQAAVERNQLHFDEMEEGHQKILAAVLTIILYHRVQL
jgi:hypothetical protein